MAFIEIHLVESSDDPIQVIPRTMLIRTESVTHVTPDLNNRGLHILTKDGEYLVSNTYEEIKEHLRRLGEL